MLSFVPRAFIARNLAP